MSVEIEMDGPVEIERKYLLKRFPKIAGLKGNTVRQGYLTGADDSVEIRLRQKGKGEKARYFMTLKSSGDLQRSEYEVRISREQFDALWPATQRRRVEKVRYKGALADGLTFEMDVFSGDLEGLKLVEVEFASVEQANAFVAPDWFGEDVTLNKGYKNKSLAVRGVPA